MTKRSNAHNLLIITFLTISSLALCSCEQEHFEIPWPSINELIKNPVKVHKQIKENYDSFAKFITEKAEKEPSTYPKEECDTRELLGSVEFSKI